jgi:chromosome segregation ATPase
MKAILLTLLFACCSLPALFAEDDFDVEDHEETALSSKRVVAFIKKHFPHRYEEMGELRREDPEAFEELFDEAHDLATEYYEMRNEHPELAEKFLRVEKSYQETWELVESLHEDGADEEEAIQGIRGKLERIFELRLEMDRAELDILEDELENAREEMEEREEEREAIIEEELEEILAELGYNDEDEDDDDDDDDDDDF